MAIKCPQCHFDNPANASPTSSSWPGRSGTKTFAGCSTSGKPREFTSLGIIFYEMATGRVPFEGETALSVAIKHKTEIPKDPKSLNPHISDDLSFENQTGDKAFDYPRKAIPNLLITSLEQRGGLYEQKG